MSGLAEPGREGLARIDAALAAHPRKDDEALAEAVRALCAWREAVIAEGAERAPVRDRLERLNAVIVVAMAVHFPEGEPAWDALRKARSWLAALLDG